MAYDIVIGGELSFDLASIGGWKNLKKWSIESLDADKYAKILHLVEYAWVQDLGELESQIADAIENEAGMPPDVESTFSDLLESLSKRKPKHESAFVSDGMGSKKVEEDIEIKPDEPAERLSKAADVDGWKNYP